MSPTNRSRLDAAIAAACVDPTLLAGLDTLLARVGRSEELAWGWDQGGCLVLAEAIRRVAGGTLVGVVDEEPADDEWSTGEIDEQSLDHVVVDFGDDYYADARGTATFNEMLDRIERLCDFTSPNLLPLAGVHDPRLAAVVIAYDEALVVQVAGYLRAEIAR
jgi:hypothetical protein